MTTDMGPPPTRIADALSTNESSETAPPLESGEPAPDISEAENHEGEAELNPSNTVASEISKSEEVLINSSSVDLEKKRDQRSNNVAVPYTIPSWSGPPCHHFFVEVLKDGVIVKKIDVNKKGAYMFGRVDLCDFVLEHPTISRFHAVLQFRSKGDAYLYDLGSTHGTFINKNEVKKKVFVDLHVGDVIRFGHSSRLYIFQGPPDLMPQEADLKSSRKAKIRLEVQDMEASLLRAKLQACLADGISWGMQEDAMEDNEDEVDEITWQNYKGQLTEKQEKTKDKVIKRLEKIGHMKKEIDAIRAKDISQGGLTQGQQTQIARNEQRISQLMEELENLEETLNDSIRESVGARIGRSTHGKKQGAMAEEDDFSSDDDDFYDRTKKSTKQKNSVESTSVETADSLLDKKEALLKQIEEKEKLLVDERNGPEEVQASTGDDALDAYMSTVSSQLVLDAKERVEKELSSLKSELDRILYLLRVADPTGEASRKRVSSTAQKSNPALVIKPEKAARDKEPKPSPLPENAESIAPEASSTQDKDNNRKPISKQKVGVSTTTTLFTVEKPQWLGAVEDRIKPETTQATPADTPETDVFVDYKDRKEILTKSDPSLKEAGPGLLIRKRSAEDTSSGEMRDSEEASGSQFKAEDAVALLLRHSRGYHVWDEEVEEDNNGLVEKQTTKNGKKPKRVIGPERPSISKGTSAYDSWVPPEGQSGDGRTSLNERFGY